MNGCSTAGQCFNPAFVHALAVPDVDMSDKLGRICVVARGDGVVDVINIESELTDVKSKSSIKSRKGTQSVSKHRIPGDLGTSHQNGRKRLQLDYSFGGHTGAVSCVQFSMFGERGKFIISGGNDKFVKVWDCFGCLDAGQTSSTTNPLHLNISLNKKVSVVYVFFVFCFFKSVSVFGVFHLHLNLGASMDRSIGSAQLRLNLKTLLSVTQQRSLRFFQCHRTNENATNTTELWVIETPVAHAPLRLREMIV